MCVLSLFVFTVRNNVGTSADAPNKTKVHGQKTKADKGTYCCAVVILILDTR